MNYKNSKPMYTTDSKNNKQVYIAPAVECIRLDNEISLQLQSTPPVLPGEDAANAPEYFSNDPFKMA